jgi:hypothetical protein
MRIKLGETVVETDCGDVELSEIGRPETRLILRVGGEVFHLDDVGDGTLAVAVGDHRWTIGRATTVFQDLGAVVVKLGPGGCSAD